MSFRMLPICSVNLRSVIYSRVTTPVVLAYSALPNVPLWGFALRTAASPSSAGRRPNHQAQGKSCPPCCEFSSLKPCLSDLTDNVSISLSMVFPPSSNYALMVCTPKRAQEASLFLSYPSAPHTVLLHSSSLITKTTEKHEQSKMWF